MNRERVRREHHRRARVRQGDAVKQPALRRRDWCVGRGYPYPSGAPSEAHLPNTSQTNLKVNNRLRVGVPFTVSLALLIVSSV